MTTVTDENEVPQILDIDEVYKTLDSIFPFENSDISIYKGFGEYHLKALEGMGEYNFPDICGAITTVDWVNYSYDKDNKSLTLHNNNDQLIFVYGEDEIIYLYDDKQNACTPVLKNLGIEMFAHLILLSEGEDVLNDDITHEEIETFWKKHSV